MPDSVMLNSYFMLYLIPLYHFPLYLIPDCPLERYNRFLFSVIPDSIMPDSVIPDSCFNIPDSVIPNSIIPDSCFACYNRFRYTRFPAPKTSTFYTWGRTSGVILLNQPVESNTWRSHQASFTVSSSLLLKKSIAFHGPVFTKSAFMWCCRWCSYCNA